MRIFLKSTQNGLLKNVKDGISRPLGSREIQKKTKVDTVLWDTLYYQQQYMTGLSIIIISNKKDTTLLSIIIISNKKA